tara:strand:+ start:332 stop:526 length:195 start_codon:yes stop_codon:yes gene_type:complete
MVDIMPDGKLIGGMEVPTVIYFDELDGLSREQTDALLDAKVKNTRKTLAHMIETAEKRRLKKAE